MGQTVVDGSFLDKFHKQKLLNRIKEQKPYKLILDKLSEAGLKNNPAESVVAYNGKVVNSFEGNEHVFKLTFAHLKLENALVYYHLVEAGEEKLESFSADLLHTNGSLITTFVVEDQEVKEVLTTEYDGQLDQMIEEELPDNPNYDHDEELLSIQAPWDICMPGGYRHCGSDCGDKGSKGGGTPINPIDTCCRSHDRCWERYGRWDCQCDRNLINCARPHRGKYPAAYATIWAVFAYNAC